jgi:hypothetical protein
VDQMALEQGFPPTLGFPPLVTTQPLPRARLSPPPEVCCAPDHAAQYQNLRVSVSLALLWFSHLSIDLLNEALSAPAGRGIDDMWLESNVTEGGLAAAWLRAVPPLACKF